jgi:hypothetical protein
MRYREEREFVVHIHLGAEFDDGYDGDDDGYAWHARFEEVLKPRLIKAVIDALRSVPGWKVAAAPRGRDPDEFFEIAVERETAR